jgi:RNA polymerase sigma-70 factor (ECF subfamily)
VVARPDGPSIRASAAGPTDADLIAAIRAGDQRACEAFVRRYAPRMLVVAGRFLRADDQRDDAVQEAFISAFRSLDTFAGGASLATWLHRITVNACLMRLRKLKRTDEVSIEALLPRFKSDGHYATRVASPPDDGPADAASRAETRARVRACIDRLPETYRAVLLLRDIEELDTDETAKLLDCTPGNVKVRLHRARQALRALLIESAVD